MTTAALTPQPKLGFFAPVPETPREDLLKDYLAFLEHRNGSVATEGAYPNREAWLAAADHRAHRRDVAVGDRGERAHLGAAVGRIEQHDVGGLAGPQQTAIETVDARVAAGRGGDFLL